MGKIVARILVVIFVLIALFVTVNLLAYNDYEVAEFGNTSLVIVDDHLKEYGYNNGDLLIVSRSNNDKIIVGDKIIYYVGESVNSSTAINVGAVSEISDDGSQFFILKDDKNTLGDSVNKDRVLGSTDSTKVCPTLGGVLGVLESRAGYLLIILLPTVVIFAYLIRKVVVELKEDEKKN